MIGPLDIAQHSALAQQSLTTDSSVRGTTRPGAPAAAPLTNAASPQTEDWFAQMFDISVSAIRAQDTVEAHSERVLSHLLANDDR